MLAFQDAGYLILIFICSSYIAFIITAIYLLFRHKDPIANEVMKDDQLRTELINQVNQAILAIAQNFRQDLQTLYQEMHASYLKDQQEFGRNMQSSLTDLKNNQTNIFSDYSATLHSTLGELSEKLQQTQLVFVSELRNVLHGRMDALHKEYSSQMKGFIDSYQRDIASYKESRLNQLKRQLDVFGQRSLYHLAQETLSDDEREALILEALEKARKEGLFNG